VFAGTAAADSEGPSPLMGASTRAVDALYSQMSEANTSAKSPKRPAVKIQKTIVVKPARKIAAAKPPAILSPAVPVTRFLWDEASNLIVPNQKYLLRYQDEDNFGKIASDEKTTVTLSFSEGEVERYREDIRVIADYRNQMKQRCNGSSTQYFVEALDKYLSALASFNRKALPLVADISENNDLMILIVNRTALIDPPILSTRYLQFKKQRFKESMNRFLAQDQQLVKAMVDVARLFKVDITDKDWNRTYGARDNALELVSLWPRDLIFEATEKLTDAKEMACVVQPRDKMQASKSPSSNQDIQVTPSE